MAPDRRVEANSGRVRFGSSGKNSLRCNERYRSGDAQEDGQCALRITLKFPHTKFDGSHFMNTQHSNDANKSTTESDKKREGARTEPGKSDKHESHEQGKSRDGGTNVRKGAFNKGEHSAGVR